ncbi:hypothetical protein JW964_21190 [candidate division KSB1 bacterium]|nr:hypothetical protein [candidate division KSB1 bacterium]
MQKLLLDQAEVHNLYLEVCGKHRMRTSLDQLSKFASIYNELYYEASSQNHLIGTLDTIDFLKEKLIVLPNNIPLGVEAEESLLLEKTITEGPNYPTILQALQHVSRIKKGPPRPYNLVLGYVVRMLLLSRQLNSDILLWPRRIPLIISLFKESSCSLQITKEQNGITVIESSSCIFPFIPPPSKHIPGCKYRFVSINTEKLT